MEHGTTEIFRGGISLGSQLLSETPTSAKISSSRSKKEGDKAWRQMFQGLLRFKIRTGNCDVPQVYRDNRKLGRWASNQRAQYKTMSQGKASPMTLDRKEALEDAGFKWKILRKEKARRCSRERILGLKLKGK